MISIETIKEINDYVREHYKSGLKSHNKTYSLDYGTKLLSQKIFRNDNADKALRQINRLRNNRHFISDIQNEIPKAGNCMEYCYLAISRVYQLGLTPSIRLYVAQEISSLNNHMFCVFNLTAETQPSPPSIYHMSASPKAVTAGAIICDPWANLVCHYDEYPAQLEAKMLKWQLAGKEVYTGQITVDAQAWGQSIINADLIDYEAPSPAHHLNCEDHYSDR